MSDLQNLDQIEGYATRLVTFAGRACNSLHTDAEEIAQTLRRAYRRSGMSEDEARVKSRAVVTHASKLYDALHLSMRSALEMKVIAREAQGLSRETTIKANVGTFGPMLD